MSETKILMIYEGVSRRETACGICKKPILKGSRVYHNTAKREGVHLAHKDCWEQLVATRPRKWNVKEPVLSREELDPPF